MKKGVSYDIRHGYEYDDGDMHKTPRVLLLSIRYSRIEIIIY